MAECDIAYHCLVKPKMLSRSKARYPPPPLLIKTVIKIQHASGSGLS